MEWIRFILANIFVLTGLFFLIISMVGVYKFGYVLNRMQTAAMGDTLGIFFCILGLITIEGFTFTSLKLLLVIVFLWISGPVSSHLISRLEVKTNRNIFKDCEVKGE